MILTINVSNSSILLGAYDSGRQVLCASLHTNLAKSADEYAVQIRSILSLHKRTPEQISGAILSCVVPSLAACMRRAVGMLYNGRIYTVGPGLKTGLAIKTDDPSQLGSELVCCAVAVLAHYTPPAVIISMDTAISFTALDVSGALRGGAILAGVKTSVDALCTRTAQLPQIELAAPSCGVLGTNTISSMQAGAVLGTASLLDGMIDRFAAALGGTPACIASGEIAPLILPHCTHAISYHRNLVLDGLYALFCKNAK